MLVPPQFRGKHPSFRSDFFGDPKARSMGVGRDLFGLRKDGSEVPVEIGLNPIMTEEGSFVLAAIVDITERKKAELQVAELDRAKTAFFSNVSHEFRTPLTLLLGPLEDALRLADGAMPAAQRERLEVSHRNALRLLKLVNTLLDFSRIEAGRIQAIFEPVDLSAYTLELASVFRSAVERAGLGFRVDCAELSEPIHIDREMWEKIVFNLIANALKFTFQGEISVALRSFDDLRRAQRARLGHRHSERRAPAPLRAFLPSEECPVSYPGRNRHRARARAGARAPSRRHDRRDQRPRDGQRLHRSHAKRDRPPPQGADWGRADARVDGFGRRAVRRGGPAVGSDPAHEPRLRIPSNQELVEQDFDAAYRILLVDDNQDMRVYLERLLAERWQVEAVSDGLEALKAARERRPDLVLSDVIMPNLDGFGLLREMRSDPNLAGVPVILLSARAGEEARVEGLESGADDYLIKPFSARELIARVKSNLELVALRRRVEEEVRERNVDLGRARESQNRGARRVGEGAPDLRVHRLSRSARPDPRDVPVCRDPAFHVSGQAVRRSSRGFVGSIASSAERMDVLVQDLLQYSRLTQSEMKLQELELGPIVSGVLGAMESEINERKGRIAVDGNLPSVTGDPVMLAQALTNLIANAIKFVPAGVEPKATIRAETENGRVRLWVEDNGIGIAPELHPKLFQVFERLVKPDEYPGTGIGLAIVRKAVERMGGDVGLDVARQGRAAAFGSICPARDSPNDGSRFALSLARRRQPRRRHFHGAGIS